MYYLEAGYGKHLRLRNALLVALGLHLLMISAVSFEFQQQNYEAMQIEVTLATQRSQRAPDEARLMAQANQQGSGELSELEAVTSKDTPLPFQAEAQQTLLPRTQEQQNSSQSLLSSQAPNQYSTDSRDREQAQISQPLPGIHPEVDRINRQLASLEAELDQQTRTYADRPRVRRLTATSARQAVDAAYLLDWRKRLEAVGNKYYPEASIRYGIYGDLRLLVVIRSDGSLDNIRVLSSSGYAVLDEAAIKIVRMASPFAPFPAELAATTDKLEIIRTWQFQENQLSSN